MDSATWDVSPELARWLARSVLTIQHRSARLARQVRQTTPEFPLARYRSIRFMTQAVLEPVVSAKPRLRLHFGVTIFTGAFLLFQVQPILGKYILPWFGGMSSVWTTCMLFFQVLLLGGYLYSHLLSTRLKPRAQASVHLAILAATIVLL